MLFDAYLFWSQMFLGWHALLMMFCLLLISILHPVLTIQLCQPKIASLLLSGNHCSVVPHQVEMLSLNQLKTVQTMMEFTRTVVSILCDVFVYYTVSHKKRGTLLLSISSPVIDRLKFFTGTLCGQFAIMWSLYIPPHRKCVFTTLLCAA